LWRLEAGHKIRIGVITLRHRIRETRHKRQDSAPLPEIGHEFSLLWIKKLYPSELPTSSEQPGVSRSADGLPVLKP